MCEWAFGPRVWFFQRENAGLFGSLPGQDESRWLEDPRVASIVAEALQRGEVE
jgi:hypothetical protein